MESRQSAINFRSALQRFAANDFKAADELADGLVEKTLEEVSVRRFGSGQKARFSVVVVSHQTTEKFLAGMKSLSEAARNLPDGEFVFVSNAHAGVEAVLQNLFSDFVFVEVGYNFGCSGGRNVGARIASSKIVVFVDDDGITTASSILELVAALADESVVAVRGQAEPFPGQITPKHYKPNDIAIPRYIDLEGMSAWRKHVFLEAGGFNVLLAGHEGVDLTWRLTPSYGYNAFRYIPAAILQHDFAPDASGLAAKEEKQLRSKRYLLHRGVDLTEVVRAYGSCCLSLFETAIFERSAAHRTIRKTSSTGSPSACFLTTVKNGSTFAFSHWQALSRQTDTDFKVLVVDDGSSDGTREAIERLWQGDDRLTVISNQGTGRSAALNTGLHECDSDIVLIADIDDISMPFRLEETKRAFEEDQEIDLLGQLIFTRQQYVRLGSPALTSISSMNVRRLFGMPAPFPAFAFRRDRIRGEFDHSLPAGVDYDWISRELEKGSRGKLTFVPTVYYHLHPGQITSKHGSVQKDVGERWIARAFESALEEKLSPQERQTTLQLAGWMPCTTQDQLIAMAQLASKVLSRSATGFSMEQEQLEAALAYAISQAKVSLLARQAKKAVPVTQADPIGTSESFAQKTLRRTRSVVRDPRLVRRILRDPTLLWR